MVKSEFVEAILSVTREPTTCSTVKCGRWIESNKVCGEPAVLVLIVDRDVPFAFGLCQGHQSLNLKGVPIDTIIAVPPSITSVDRKLDRLLEHERPDERRSKPRKRCKWGKWKKLLLTMKRGIVRGMRILLGISVATFVVVWILSCAMAPAILYLWSCDWVAPRDSLGVYLALGVLGIPTGYGGLWVLLKIDDYFVSWIV